MDMAYLTPGQAIFFLAIYILKIYQHIATHVHYSTNTNAILLWLSLRSTLLALLPPYYYYRTDVTVITINQPSSSNGH